MAETGHNINLANLDRLIQAVNSFGTRYNPSNPALTVAALTDLRNSITTQMSLLATNKATLNSMRNSRQETFADLERIARRVKAAAKAAGATTQQLSDIEEVTRKIKGDRAGTKKAASANPDDPQSISVSQLSYVSLAGHLQNLTSVLESIPAYAPNETELSLTGLNTLRQAMTTANQNVANAELNYQNALAVRNAGMYAAGAGLLDIAKAVKDYVYSASPLGAKNPDYKIVKAITFTRINKG